MWHRSSKVPKGTLRVPCRYYCCPHHTGEETEAYGHCMGEHQAQNMGSLIANEGKAGSMGEDLTVCQRCAGSSPTESHYNPPRSLLVLTHLPDKETGAQIKSTCPRSHGRCRIQAWVCLTLAFSCPGSLALRSCFHLAHEIPVALPAWGPPAHMPLPPTCLWTSPSSGCSHGTAAPRDTFLERAHPGPCSLQPAFPSDATQPKIR